VKPVVVVDASVAVKWFLPLSPVEPDADLALDLLQAYRDDLIELLEPSIWQAEVAAVLARLVPDESERLVWRLLAFDHTHASGVKVYLKATQLAVSLQHHLFDTIYHASALMHPSAVLITADEKYRLKAQALGRILPLAGWKEVFDLISGEVRPA
jgi:predicted nucleic acid-binding protein